MKSVKYNSYKWIFHAKNHFTKYSLLYPLTSKEIINVVEVLKCTFYRFGALRILESDSRHAFMAKVIHDSTKL